MENGPKVSGPFFIYTYSHNDYNFHRLNSVIYKCQSIFQLNHIWKLYFEKETAHKD